jgi:hypothetical protein
MGAYMPRKRAESDTEEKLYFVKNKSKMNRCASGDTPKTEDPLASPSYEVVRIEQGYNAFTQEQMDIINKCSYTKDKFGEGEFKWFVIMDEEEFSSDRRIEAVLRDTKQISMLQYLLSKAKSSTLIKTIEDRMPAHLNKEQWAPPEPMSSL